MAPSRPAAREDSRLGKYQELVQLDKGSTGSADLLTAPSLGESFPRPGHVWWYSHRDGLSLWSKLMFSWLNPLLATGANKLTLEQEDLLEMPPELMAETLHRHFQSIWHSHLSRPTGPSLVGAVHTMFRRDFWVAGVFRLLTEVCNITSPLLVREIILFVKRSSTTVPQTRAGGIILALGLFLVVLLQAVTLQQFIHGVFMVGAELVSTATAAVFDKAMRLSRGSAEGSRLGEVLNLQAKDASKLREFVVFFHNLWAAPLTAIGCTVLLFWVLGPSALVGVALIPVLIPVETWVAKKGEQYRKAVLKVADTRINLVSEIVDGMKTVKLNSLEAHFQAKVEALRDAELRSIRQALVLQACNQAVMRSSPVLVALATFAAYTLAGHQLTAETAFTALALFNTVSHPFHVMPKAISLLADAKVSMKRLESFLLEKETQRADAFVSNDDGSRGPAKPEVVLVEASIGPVSKPDLLRGVTLDLGPGLTLLVGPVGAGKSSLLRAIASGMDGAGHSGQGITASSRRSPLRISSRGGRLALCPETPWIFNASVRDNVCIGSPHEEVDEERYRQALEACALVEDIAEWPLGDDTVIGEKGITISGGQKSRIALARALYAECEVVLLDDPLSALDNTVGRQVFDRVVKSMARTSVVVMATHQQQYLKDADSILVIKEGRVAAQGDHRQLLQSGVDLSGMVREDQPSRPVEAPGPERMGKAQESTQSMGAANGTTTAKLNGNGKTMAVKKRDPNADADRLRGGVSLSIYTGYFRACGLPLVLAGLAVSVLAQVVSVGKEGVLARWSDSGTGAGSYLAIYAAVCLSTMGANVLRFFMTCYMGLHASKSLHQQLLRSVMGTRLQFFQTTSAGRITSRFSSDCDTIDLVIPTSLASFLDAFLTMITAVAVVTFTTPAFVVFMVPIAWAYAKIQAYYRVTSKELKRLDSATRSPIFSHFEQAMDGIFSVQAYRIEPRMARKNFSLIDANAQARLNWDAANRWLGIRLDVLGTLVVFLAALLAVLLGGPSAGAVGMGLSYALTITRTLSFGVRSSTALENQFNSVERVLEFVELEREPQTEGETVGAAGAAPERLVPPSWPSHEISLDDVHARYRTDLPPALRGVSLTIGAGETVGVCGRTGCGKSTLALALIRVVECCGGSIRMDGVDVREVPLRVLRSRVTLISQDARLFSGTVREAVDPTGQLSDLRLWEVLQLVGMGTAVGSMPSGLDSGIKEGGGNWSAGQRQLLCIARAIAGQSSVLVFDEASAAVDVQTDKIVRNLIARHLTASMVVVIAHRLEDIIACDQVVVMGSGQVLEVGTPFELLSKARGAFASLVHELGPELARGIACEIESAAKARLGELRL